MEWVKLSTTYYLDAAVVGLTADAEILFLRGLAYSGNAETGGFIPAAALPILARRRPIQSAQELVDTGLWEHSPTGYMVKSWDAWQRDLEDVKRKRELARERQRRKRRREHGEDDGEWKT